LADHVAHALQQWPDEDRFKLASAMQIAVTADSEPPHDVAWVKTDAISRDSQEGKRRARATKAIEMFDGLLQIPSLRAEASVRKGYLQLTLNDPQDALLSFASGEETDDTFVVYLARFLAGRAFDRMGQRENANEKYRAAVRAIPDAQSANEALSANMFLLGQPDEAYALARAALSGRGAAEDPWHEFGYGDRRLIPPLMTQLREAIR
jgi:tetratricopeptide (TPR) repeat protein